MLSCSTAYFVVQDGPEELLSRCMKPYGVTIQIKATEQYFPFVLFMMLYKMVLKIFLSLSLSVDETLKPNIN